MPFLALLEADVKKMYHSWAVRIWAVLLAAQMLFFIAVSTGDEVASELLASHLASFPLIWSTVVIVVSSGAISSEAGVVADSILSKPVTRYQYVTAKLISRLGTVLGLYLIVALPAAYAIPRNAPGDVERAGVVWAVVSVGMMMLLLTSIAVAGSTLFNRTMVAVIVTWFLWYAAGAIVGLLGVQYLSPLRVVEALPDTLMGDYDTSDQIRNVLGFGLPSVLAIAGAGWYFAHKDL